MKTILNDSKDPTFNLALEEYVLKELDSDEDFVLLWQNANSVIIGRNQNTYEEVNPEVVKEQDVKVVRRITGGGAVYHDLGNLNFSFITKSLKDNLNNYKKFTDPVIAALKEMGVEAEFQGRNDIVVDGKKISGNAQAYYKNKMLHHGTILYDANLAFVASVLNVKQDKIQSKGIKSNRARVTNIKPLMEDPVDMEYFKEKLMNALLGKIDIKQNIYNLTEDDLNHIRTLQKTKYQAWKWNYGESPTSSNIKEKRYPGGKLEIHFDLNQGKIENLKLYGDFLDTGDVSKIESSLQGCIYDENHIKEVLSKIQISDYILNISNEDLIDCLFT